MDPSQFQTIEQKKTAYDYQQAHSLKETLDILEKFHNKNPNSTYFRGQSNGSWKLYSFLQREWMSKGLNRFFDSYENLISKLLDFSKNQLYPNSPNDANLTDCKIFSTLQHYGTPTPFVDWTSDYRSALYFASLIKPEYIENSKSQELASSYISVYWLVVGNRAETPNNDLTDIGMALNDFYQNEAIELNSMEKQNIIEQFYNKTQWGNLPWFFSDNYFPLVNIKNPRQNAQKGGFFYSGDCSKSLDEIFDGKESTNNFPKIHCLDIDTSTVSEIQCYLKKENINNETLGLNSLDWGKLLFNYFLEHYKCF